MAPSTTSRWCRRCPPVALVALVFVALGSVLVGGLGDTGDARHRGKVEAFGGHDGWYASDDSGIVVVDVGRPEIILSRNYRFLFRPLYDLFCCKTVKNSEK
jgi:hypothetical protein